MSENDQDLEVGVAKTPVNSLDIKQLGLIASIASLGYVFWVVGAMEMVERLAFYGVRSVARACGCFCGPGLTFAPNGILAACLPICFVIPT